MVHLIKYFIKLY